MVAISLTSRKTTPTGLKRVSGGYPIKIIKQLTNKKCFAVTPEHFLVAKARNSLKIDILGNEKLSALILDKYSEFSFSLCLKKGGQFVLNSLNHDHIRLLERVQIYFLRNTNTRMA